MTTGTTVTVPEIVCDLDSEPRTLTVLNRTQPEPIYRMLRDVFEGEAVTVEETGDVTGRMEDVVLLREDGEVVGTSMLPAVLDAVLLVNSDSHVTGARSIEDVDTPEVIARLDDTRLFAEGYPSTGKQKMLLIGMSRHIERQAWNVGEGQLHAGVQRLSRIDDESGTRDVYEELGATDVEVHAYGVPDWDPDLPLRNHGVDDGEMCRSWFVAFDPPRDGSREVALAAYKPELGSNESEAFWTHDPDRVDRTRDHLRDRYVEDTPAGVPGA